MDLSLVGISIIPSDTGTHSPLSTFLRLHEPVTSDLPVGDVLKNHKGSYLELFTKMLFFLVDKDGNSSRFMAALSVSHSPDGVTVTPYISLC